ncbi:DNA primase family protein [Streptomyces caniscabiei]|uniref:DNA primase n=1 Tax=Streptomyces caniscabiei TaxID=2746961 RepID=A0A927LAZ6_9ACTN|nr:phage/plasmid primase, P4 family [Streptomyces caniscabiei]MBD9704648.1 DNA primase [Streptomyces caniscabiei]MBD9729376.1 DNA primase [Streptomyces caniscabiei]MDX3515042.1 phage/plasmid primase, P4 family [Streptomyces caniscabiei]MDX3724338.1 phage/plasmid primase, P4 family [Streptomyces caniscabiei]MDX3733763.1 phage/plasmid primase, P4 family [Streptomyces caniscabiei]
MTSGGQNGLFDAHMVAQQILDQSPPETAPQVGKPDPAPVAGGEATAAGLLPDTLSDRGNAKLFVRLYAHDYRHVPGLGWFRWDSTRWQVDEDDTVVWAAGDLAESLATTDPRGIFTSAALQQHRRRALSTSGMNAMLAQARTAPGMVLNAALLDADPYALCTPAGIVDLHTGLIRTPLPDKDFHSRSTTAAPQPMRTPRWHRFLSDTFGEGPEGAEMIDFLHLLLGYSITGDVGGQIMPFLFGSGRNGKSVLLDVLMKLLGDYADAAPPGFLMARPYEGHPTDLAELHGRRVIVCSEVRPGDRFDEARVKLLTGGDRIKARRMRQDFFSFEPTHKLWLLGNHRPEVGTGGFAFWRRMRLIPFERVVPYDRKIDNLADILVTEEGPGILNWLILGARRYLNGERDLTGPARVRIATSAYAETEDHTGRFFGECCRLEGGLRSEQAQLYAAYKAWCQNEEAPAISSRAFAARVRELVGLASPKEMILSNQRKYYPGIGLVADEETA